MPDNASIRVGHPAIDDAHEALAGIFDRLDAAIAANDRPAATRLGEELFRTFEAHFVDEEHLMSDAGYSDDRRKAHIRGHNAFTENLLTFMATLPDPAAAGRLAPLAARLREDFTDHLIRSDGELARFLDRKR